MCVPKTSEFTKKCFFPSLSPHDAVCAVYPTMKPYPCSHPCGLYFVHPSVQQKPFIHQMLSIPCTLPCNHTPCTHPCSLYHTPCSIKPPPTHVVALTIRASVCLSVCLSVPMLLDPCLPYSMFPTMWSTPCPHQAPWVQPLGKLPLVWQYRSSIQEEKRWAKLYFLLLPKQKREALLCKKAMTHSIWQAWSLT